ncbi:MAG: HAMP domain-containing sensor histidine kinase [bacterium]
MNGKKPDVINLGQFVKANKLKVAECSKHIVLKSGKVAAEMVIAYPTNPVEDHLRRINLAPNLLSLLENKSIILADKNLKLKTVESLWVSFFELKDKTIAMIEPSEFQDKKVTLQLDEVRRELQRIQVIITSRLLRGSKTQPSFLYNINKLALMLKSLNYSSCPALKAGKVTDLIEDVKEKICEVVRKLQSLSALMTKKDTLGSDIRELSEKLKAGVNSFEEPLIQIWWKLNTLMVAEEALEEQGLSPQKLLGQVELAHNIIKEVIKNLDQKLSQSPININDLLEPILAAALKRDTALTIDKDLKASPVFIMAASNLETAFYNVIQHALYAEPGNPSEKRQLKVRTFLSIDRSKMIIQISNSGPGIKDLPKIYKDFSSQGIGLGDKLAIAKQVIEYHGGHIWPENIREVKETEEHKTTQEGHDVKCVTIKAGPEIKGARFTVILPVHKEEVKK